ncbi:MAG: hypothetical protein RLW62_21620 [Gammaproteobacteria bacterium]
MNWAAISSISDLIAALAVVASLVFVGLQLRSNTKALRLSSTNTIVEQFTSGVTRIAENPGMSGILFRGIQDPDALAGEERYRFNLALQSILFVYANIHHHYQSGTLDHDIFESMDSQMRNLCNSPGFVGYWARSGENFPARFRAHMEQNVLGRHDPAWSVAVRSDR